MEAGFLPGVTLRLLAPSSQKRFGADPIFAVHGRGRHQPPGEPDEVRLSLLADVPFPRLSAARFFSSLLAASVVLRQWLSLAQLRSPS